MDDEEELPQINEAELEAEEWAQLYPEEFEDSELDCSSGDLTALNLAIGAPESNPEYAPTNDNPF